MTKSIVQENDGKCFLCRREVKLEVHHCIYGTANRRLSDEDGLIVWLCPECHRNGPNAVHRNPAASLFVKEEAQRAWERTYGSREDFMKRYGINYLEDEK